MLVSESLVGALFALEREMEVTMRVLSTCLFALCLVSTSEAGTKNSNRISKERGRFIYGIMTGIYKKSDFVKTIATYRPKGVRTEKSVVLPQYNLAVQAEKDAALFIATSVLYPKTSNMAVTFAKRMQKKHPHQFKNMITALAVYAAHLSSEVAALSGRSVKLSHPLRDALKKTTKSPTPTDAMIGVDIAQGILEKMKVELPVLTFPGL